jgi:hypothetical protein
MDATGVSLGVEELCYAWQVVKGAKAFLDIGHSWGPRFANSLDLFDEAQTGNLSGSSFSLHAWSGRRMLIRVKKWVSK